MKNFMGRCPWCGTEIGVMAEDQSEADMLAEEKCLCEAAETGRNKEKMADEVDRLIGRDCTKEDNELLPVEKDVYTIIFDAAMLAVEGVIEGAVFKVDGTNITIKSGTKTTIKRERKYVRTGEVG